MVKNFCMTGLKQLCDTHKSCALNRFDILLLFDIVLLLLQYPASASATSAPWVMCQGPFDMVPPVPHGVMLAGQEDQLRIDGINRLIKAMQKIFSLTPAAAQARPKLAQIGMQTAAIRSSTPVSISTGATFA